MKNYLLQTVKYIMIAAAVVIVSLEAAILYGGRNNFNKDARYIIVLGAKLHGDRPSRSLVFRMDKAIFYMKKNPKMIMIATGGQGHDETVPEGQAIKKYCVSKGIDSGRIIVEDKSENTFENLKFARKLIDEKGTVEANIVSNNYHILRAKMLAERSGFKPYGVPAKTPKKVLVKSYIREALAVVKSYIFDR